MSGTLTQYLDVTGVARCICFVTGDRSVSEGVFILQQLCPRFLPDSQTSPNGHSSTTQPWTGACDGAATCANPAPTARATSVLVGKPAATRHACRYDACFVRIVSMRIFIQRPVVQVSVFVFVPGRRTCTI